ncbi:MAG: protein adenylyltransferase SelO family protein [Gammaproteobacteria bacterium]|nr:protein adenylyltransferase SelO family protein [Gammaproteobacteria bacterium]
MCNHTDTQGRYAFNTQPQIGLWNIMCLAESFTGLVEREALKEILAKYEIKFGTILYIAYAQQAGPIRRSRRQ